jgi:hypothetical protein
MMIIITFCPAVDCTWGVCHRSLHEDLSDMSSRTY